jgi:tetratricopeptide (TPR) repeat protein
VTRFEFLLSCLAPFSVSAAQQAQQPPPAPAEEDETLAPKEYGFNPLQAAKELKIGNFYFKKKSWKAALARYEEAVKWDPGMAEAWLRLGETREKMGDKKAAREAWSKYLEISPDAKNAVEIRKRIGKGG